MKVILAFDSFKGSLSAAEACAAAGEGVARLAGTETVACPLSDGGEGFAAAMQAAGGEARAVEVTGPLFTPVCAEIVYLDGGSTAVIESAQACGLGLVPTMEGRSPLRTTTRGLGEMLAAAVEAGATTLVVGLGGSATNDGGMGLLAGLGWQFLGENGQPLPPVGASLGQVARIVPGRRLDGVSIVAACDVTNPLYGSQGAAYTFAPQKGASSEEVATLDAGLRHYAEVCAALLGEDFSGRPGAGAAGGLGFALLAFLGAAFKPGAALAIELTGLEGHLRSADLCLTGEGQTDFQTAYGKLPAAVAARCQAADVPCVCLSGALGEGWRTLYDHGFTALFSICQRPQNLDAAMASSHEALADAAEAVTRLRLM